MSRTEVWNPEWMNSRGRKLAVWRGTSTGRLDFGGAGANREFKTANPQTILHLRALRARLPRSPIGFRKSGGHFPEGREW
jgi:hypothetical protein